MTNDHLAFVGALAVFGGFAIALVVMLCVIIYDIFTGRRR